jgi:phage regulator Rha-like protein
MSATHLVKNEEIQNKIYTVRGMQVMLDEDLANLYGVETRIVNQAVNRNKARFPTEFMFQLSKDEYGSLRSQFVILENNATLESARGKHRKYLPFAFTEQGVAMLSAVLKSETAVKASIAIMNAFVAMRRFISSNAQIFQRLDSVERKQLKYKTDTDKKFEKIFNAIEEREIIPKQGIFFDGQIFDAYKFVAGLVRKANKSIVLIDNYVDETVLDLFSKKKKNVALSIFTSRITKALQLDAKKFNAQHPPLEIKKFSKAHDRFLIIDDKNVYHFGASLKDLGKKWFAFSKMDKTAFSLLDNLKKVIVDD